MDINLKKMIIMIINKIQIDIKRKIIIDIKKEVFEKEFKIEIMNNIIFKCIII